jgi:hypothetical protein
MRSIRPLSIQSSTTCFQHGAAADAVPVAAKATTSASRRREERRRRVM